MIVKLIFLCDLFLVLCVLIKSQQIGEGCIVDKTGEAGIRTKVYSCDDAIQDWNSQTLYSAYKTSEHLDADACCPAEEVNRFSRISEQKCAEYAMTVSKHIELRTMTYGSSITDVLKVKCDYPILEHVEKAEVLEFPHMALIGYREKPSIGACAGSLISDLYVLAPAHCREYEGELAKYVVLGQVNEFVNSRQQFEIANFTTFPAYLPGENYHDIGLIKLDRKVEFGPTIRPACLPTYFDDPIKNPIATVFTCKDPTEAHTFHVVKVKTEKLDYKQCKEYESKLDLTSGVSNETHICVKRQRKTPYPSPNVIKGPLQINHHSRFCMYTLVGVNSLATVNTSYATVDIYTRVISYMNWIEETLWPNLTLSS